MNIADVDNAYAERDASPIRTGSRDPNHQLEAEYRRIHEERRRSHRADQATPYEEAVETPATEEPSEEIEEQPRNGRRGSNGTSSVSSYSTASIRREQMRNGHGARPRPRHMSTVSRASTGIERDIMAYLDRHPTAVARVEEHKLQHMQTVGSSKPAQTRDGESLPDFGGNKPYPPPLPEREEYVVEFSGFDDPKHAQNFPMKKKVIIGSVLVFFSLAATFASSIYSAGSGAIGQEFNVGREVTTLGTSLFVLGYAMGPSVFAPMSELYGRRTPIIVAAVGFGIFNTAVAVAKDYQTLMISRFFSGFFGSAPLAITGAVFADMFDNKTRGIAVACFSATLMNGTYVQ